MCKFDDLINRNALRILEENEDEERIVKDELLQEASRTEIMNNRFANYLDENHLIKSIIPNQSAESINTANTIDEKGY